MDNYVITIDGPAGVGKSSVSIAVAKRTGAAFLDTGAMYRTVTLAAMRKGVDLADEGALLNVLSGSDFRFDAAGDGMRIELDGADVTEDIRKPEVTANVRYIASATNIRGKLVEMQRAFVARHARVVTEGRDQGTVAFPDAKFKFFLTADAGERGRRRKAQLLKSGIAADINKLVDDIQKRDSSDSQREVGPLKPADDAIIIDTTNLNFDQVVELLLEHIK
jgi:CMP/dCMP kinase